MASCVSDTPYETTQGAELQFAISGVSRTYITSNTDFTTKGSKFAIFGEKMFQGETDFHGPVVIFNGDPVTYGGKTWSYNEPQYWFPGHEYSFVALYPYSALSKSCFNYEYKNPTLYFTYSFPTSGNTVEVTEVADIVIATHRRLYSDGGNNKIGFNFSHIMSRIDIAAEVSDTLFMYTGDDESKLDPDPDFNDQIIKNEYIQFRRLELHGVRTKADFSVTPALLNTAGQTNDYEITINVDESLPPANMIYEISENAGHIVNSGKDQYGVEQKFITSIFPENEGIILLPQTMPSDAYIVMYYTVNADSYNEDNLRKITVPLQGRVLESGKSYRLSCTVENVYEGQIKPGSLKWTVIDLSDSDANDRWISDGGTIKQNFDKEDGKH